MELAVKETMDVPQLWLKKAEAMQTIYLLTLEQSKACAAEDTQRLLELLEQRQNWMDQVDALDTWMSALDAHETVPAALQEEVKELLKKIRQVDAYNQKIAADKLGDIKNGIRDNSRMKQGMRSYIQGSAVVDGMYFDTKK
ncbi:MAG: hypothetical protein ACOYU3_07920 [Bacillota bacterium]